MKSWAQGRNGVLLHFFPFDSWLFIKFCLKHSLCSKYQQLLDAQNLKRHNPHHRYLIYVYGISRHVYINNNKSVYPKQWVILLHPYWTTPVLSPVLPKKKKSLLGKNFYKLSSFVHVCKWFHAQGTCNLIWLVWLSSEITLFGLKRRVSGEFDCYLCITGYTRFNMVEKLKNVKSFLSMYSNKSFSVCLNSLLIADENKLVVI